MVYTPPLTDADESYVFTQLATKTAPNGDVLVGLQTEDGELIEVKWPTSYTPWIEFYEEPSDGHETVEEWRKDVPVRMQEAYENRDDLWAE